jgi:hypothetical protein
MARGPSRRSHMNKRISTVVGRGTATIVRFVFNRGGCDPRVAATARDRGRSPVAVPADRVRRVES